MLNCVVVELSSVKTGWLNGDGVVLEFVTSNPEVSTCDNVSVGTRLYQLTPEEIALVEGA